ncbi:uncharacterized protein LOC113560047 [Rhopalosiphum maidis]|uniref:uncharacterized protein LOC113560047 n=1 Tax=Rhopalosiphum maidis TaxID=43146 RepID=UPI000EFF09F4|nr:uncharacterized protein LOC113560047 [Rhopalosiphum maidis]
MSSLLKIICMAEAAGELDEPTHKRRRYWVYPIHSSNEHDIRFQVFYDNLKKYPEKFFDYYRMSISSFEELLEKVRLHLTKEITHFRNPISPEKRLTVTLRYLSMGTNFAALHFDFSIGKSTINGIVKETCKILWSVLLEAEMPQPTKETWLQISDLFYKKTNFPNCLGTIDGKHIRCKNPNHAGSLFFNYKKYFSIVLIAVVDANLNFISIDVGAYDHLKIQPSEHILGGLTFSITLWLHNVWLVFD